MGIPANVGCYDGSRPGGGGDISLPPPKHHHSINRDLSDIVVVSGGGAVDRSLGSMEIVGKRITILGGNDGGGEVSRGRYIVKGADRRGGRVRRYERMLCRGKHIN